MACRKRRIKCTEEKPACKRCTDTGRTCDGYAVPKQPPAVAFLLIISDGVQIEPHREAGIACQYFHEVCAPALVNYGSASFWNRLVLQACHTDESLRHLVIAASQLDLQLRQSTSSSTPSNMVHFHSHYGKGLRLIAQSQNPDAASLLIACLLLILCDELQQNHFSALQHLIAGRKILTAYLPCSASRIRNPVIDEIGPIFSKLDSATGEFQKHLIPAHFQNPNLDPLNHPYTDDSHHLSCLSRLCPFDSIHQAACALQVIASDCTRSRVQGIAPRTRFHMVTSLTGNLNQWHARFNALERYLPTGSASKTFMDLNLLRIYNLCLHIISRCAPFGQELAFDGHSETIELVMVSCDLLIARTLTTRYFPPLFFVATRYRSLSFRRRAIKSLRKCGPDGQLLAYIASRIMRLEEEGVLEPVVCSDIPETKRVQIQSIAMDSSTQSYTLYFRRYPFTKNILPEHLTFPSRGWLRDGSPLPSSHPVRFLYSQCEM